MVLRSLYAGATRLAAPALRLLLRRRLARGKELAARLPEREGIESAPRPEGRLLWLHAASVGESVSVLPVLAALPPDLHVLMTTGTVTSAHLLSRRLPEMGLEARVTHRFVPLDVPAWAARFLDHWRPDASAFVESEIWPNLLAACRARGIPTMLVNARVSPRSFARWRRVPGLARDLFGGFDLVQAQSPAVAERVRALGACRVIDEGNLKFAAPPLPCDPATLAQAQAALADRPFWLAASTNAGEEALLMPVHDRLAARFPDLVTIIVPRHPERGAEIADIASPRAATRRGLGEGPPPGGVWVADTLGEMGLFYRLAPFAFVGRSLVKLGGQNPLEPARLGRAVAMGPHVFNFPEAVDLLQGAGALVQVADPAALGEWVAQMLAAPHEADAMGARGEAALRGFEGLPARVAQLLAELAHARP